MYVDVATSGRQAATGTVSWVSAYSGQLRPRAPSVGGRGQCVPHEVLRNAWMHMASHSLHELLSCR